MRKYPLILGAGFMVNYACTARCRHCMYGCSNKGSKDYVTPENADKIMKTLSDNGVYSLHIGGGEPFLDFEGLCTVIKAMNRYGIAVDYIETNAFWCHDLVSAKEKLHRLLELGVDAVMASCDPFHAEWVPVDRVLTFIQAARETGMGYFVWKDQFLRRLMKLDTHKAHTTEELKAVLGENYIAETAKEYGIGMNGRALFIAKEIYPEKPGFDIASSAPCKRILEGRHCHVDLYGNVVPAGCTGIAIPLEVFLNPDRTALYDEEKYPVLARVLQGGCKALLDYAVSLGFDPETKAATSCHLCYQIRCFLRENAPAKELGPDCFYEMMET